MSKKTLCNFIAALALLSSTKGFAFEENLLLVDSNFPALKADGFDLSKPFCHWVTEEPYKIADQGACGNDEDWKSLGSVDMDLLRGLQDTLAKTPSEYAKKWVALETSHGTSARNIKLTYSLSVHGTRAAFVAAKAAGGNAKIHPLRVTSMQSGTHAQSMPLAKEPLPELATKKYEDSCALVNWTAGDVKSFEKDRLLPYVNQIAAVLDNNKAIKVVNLSLGYRHSYIQEDNPACTPDKVSKDFKVLQSSWRNLFRKFKDRIFVVAAGNEGQNLDLSDIRKDDLWASLSSESNLILVGSLNSKGERLSSSNYGKVVYIMAPGENLDVFSPLPKTLGGHKTTVRGTSFSAPLVSGKAIAILSKKPSASVDEVKAELKKHFK